MSHQEGEGCRQEAVQDVVHQAEGKQDHSRREAQAPPETAEDQKA